MKMRESFEAWAKQQGRSVGTINGITYFDPFVSGLWQGWQASRAAIVLRESTGGYIAGEYGNGYADALHEVKQAIGVDVP